MHPTLSATDPFELADAPGDARDLVADLNPPTRSRLTTVSVSPEVEKFIGWGFKDWFEVEDARPEQKAEWQEQLELARCGCASTRTTPSRSTPSWFVRLPRGESRAVTGDLPSDDGQYPNTPTAYNNYALVLKREGEYVEEAPYRRARARPRGYPRAEQPGRMPGPPAAI